MFNYQAIPFFIVVFAYVFVLLSLPWFFFKGQNELVVDLETINAKDAHSIQLTVSTLAHCTQTQANVIHTQLKKEFNYNSYKFIDRHTYKKLLKYIDMQIESRCPHEHSLK